MPPEPHPYEGDRYAYAAVDHIVEAAQNLAKILKENTHAAYRAGFSSGFVAGIAEGKDGGNGG